jgi:HCOMODA/2-hydroxy-3-carboxy-muconic semialdehyde decarboxylase
VSPASTLRGDLVEAAHALSRLGLVTAYGHVSARCGASMLITPAADLAIVTESSVVTVPLDTPSLPAGAPAEAWAHLALYQARPDAESVARAQPASAFAAAAMTAALTPLYGQAAWLGASVPVHDSAHLRRSADLAERAAKSLQQAKRCCCAEMAHSPWAVHLASRWPGCGCCPRPAKPVLPPRQAATSPR